MQARIVRRLFEAARLPVLLLGLALPPSPAAAEIREEVEALARALAARPYEAPKAALPAELKALSYDQYQSIRFDPRRTLWAEIAGGLFRVQFFPAGFIYDQPVEIFTVRDDVAQPLEPTREMFDWDDARIPKAPAGAAPLAGFKVLFPLHDPAKQDEVAAFLGASYFRLLGREQTYGISARGIAIDTGLNRQEEFPRFRAFWLVEPKPDAQELTIHALLDSPGMAGAYSFVLRPGTRTVAEVRALLVARHDITLVGVAPLTSMHFTGKLVDRVGGDFRPEVHDSDGILIRTAADEWIWRPLVNPRSLRTGSFVDANPRGFGLLQRERDFAAFQDLQAHYEARPSLWVEPDGAWGEGEVRLLELPTNSEIHDNVIAFWVGKEPVRAGRALELRYRLIALSDEAALTPLGRVVATRAAALVNPGLDNPRPRARRFLIDFAGGPLEALRPAQPLRPEVNVSGAKVIDARLEPIPRARAWRVALDVEPEGGRTAELRVRLWLRDQLLTETWSHALRP